MSGRENIRGFSTPFAIVAVALLSLAVWAAATALGGQQRRLWALAEQVRLEVDAATVEARVAHLLLTEPIGARAVRVGGDPVAGVDPVAGAPSSVLAASGRAPAALVLDARPYRTSAPGEPRALRVRVQDEAGLLNLNAFADAPLARALTQLGVLDARGLAAVLADFTDEDDLTRLNGAEATDYRRAGLTPPPNRPLQSPRAALAARGWRASLTAGQQRGLFAMAATAPPERRLNLNTAPPEVLRAVFGLDERAAAQVLAAREQSPLQSVEEIAKLAGVRAVSDGAAVGVLPGRRLRLTVGLDAPRAGQAAVYQSQLVLAPEGADRPFYRRRIAGRASERRTEGGGRDGGLDELPHSPDLLAARGR